MFFKKKFIFSPEEESQIVNSIQQFEKKTSGEIRVHLNTRISIGAEFAATRTFKKLKMHKTQLRNGVLIYIDFRRKKLVILGDKGIHEKVSNSFWNAVLNHTLDQFKHENLVEGICNAIQECGEKLAQYFPHNIDDTNELPDDISYS